MRTAGLCRSSALLTLALAIGILGALVSPAGVSAAATDRTAYGAEPLPTVQIDGVAWAQAVVGNTVYVGGKFTKARPAGVAPGGPGEVTRNNLLAYNLATGELLADFDLPANNQVRALTLSPDGSRLYIGGQFNSLGGQTRYRLAALDTATRQLLPWQPSINASVYAIAAGTTQVYIGGAFTTVTGQFRDGAAAVSTDTGRVTQWAPKLTGGDPEALALSPDQTKVMLGGNFTATNGSSNPGSGLALVTADTGASLPLAANSIVRNAGTKAAITSLYGAADGVYGTTYLAAKTGGSLEGPFKVAWDGSLTWLLDCHGDTYSAYAAADSVYVAGHSHYCANAAGFYQTTEPMNYYHGIATTLDARGITAKDTMGYPNLEGNPRPDLREWFPTFTPGTFTGQSQGPWNVAGNADYLVYGGEFLSVSGVAQQGLVRFANRLAAAPKAGPKHTGSLVSYPMSDGKMRISVPAARDVDDATLTYTFYRDGARIGTVTATSRWWEHRLVGFSDTGLNAGQSYSYQVQVSDPDGNTAWTPAQVLSYRPGTQALPYLDVVANDNPSFLWPLQEVSAGQTTELLSNIRTETGNGVSNSTDAPFNGAKSLGLSRSWFKSPRIISQTKSAPHTSASVEIWFRTSSSGTIMSFRSPTEDKQDRVLYVNSRGQLTFGVRPSTVRTVSSPQDVRDGRWHHTIASYGQDGLVLYLDGVEVARDRKTLNAQHHFGVWRLGGDSLTGWPRNPVENRFDGNLAFAAVFPSQLTSDQVTHHYNTAMTGTAKNRPPAAAFTLTNTHLDASFDASASNDPDGTITGYAWDFGDGATATGKKATHRYGGAGTYNVTLKVTDNQGATATSSKQVVATLAPLDVVKIRDTFQRQGTNWGSAEQGGKYTYVLPPAFSADGTAGLIKLTAPRQQAMALLSPTIANPDIEMTYALANAPTGRGVQTTVMARRNGNTDYRMSVQVISDGSVLVNLTKVVGGEVTNLGDRIIPGLVYRKGEQLKLRFVVAGSDATTLQAWVWKATDQQPASASLARTDTNQPLVAGGFGIVSYLTGSTTSVPMQLRFLDLRVTDRAKP